MPSGKKLYLLRHAAALSTASGRDKDRALAPKGKEDAAALGRMMKDVGYAPSYALCSPARRTKETLESLKASLDIAAIHYPDVLYNASAGDLFTKIQSAPDAQNEILLIAHNPGIHQLAVLLAGQGASSLRQRLAAGYNPATMSVITCACEHWADLKPGENTLSALLDPLDYNAPARPTRWT